LQNFRIKEKNWEGEKERVPQIELLSPWREENTMELAVHETFKQSKGLKRGRTAVGK